MKPLSDEQTIYKIRSYQAKGQAGNTMESRDSDGQDGGLHGWLVSLAAFPESNNRGLIMEEVSLSSLEKGTGKAGPRHIASLSQLATQPQETQNSVSSWVAMCQRKHGGGASISERGREKWLQSTVMGSYLGQGSQGPEGAVWWGSEIAGVTGWRGAGVCRAEGQGQQLRF